MNWKIRMVLLFAKFRKPIDASADSNIALLRKKSDRAAALGSFLFDKKVPVASIQDVNADGINLRIFKNSSTQNQRVILYFHGGGFVLYGIYSHDLVCRRLCHMNNCIVVSVDYRLAPEHSFPAAHDDCFTALKWVRQHISKFGGDAEDIVVAGDSAGGNLAACMAHKCRKAKIPLTAQVLIYPWIDGKLSNPSIDKNGKGFLLEKETMFWFQKKYTPRVEDHCAPEVSPCYETEFTGLAPALIITAGLDPLRDDGRNYFSQLVANGVAATYKENPELFHGFFNTPYVHKSAIQSYDDIKQFLSGRPKT